MTETVLYFGQSKPDGSTVTAKEWEQFNQTYISKVFKEGYSVTSINGFWKDTVTNKLISEHTYEVTYCYKRSAAISKRIDSLCYRYKTIFQQQSVLRVDHKVKASF